MKSKSGSSSSSSSKSSSSSEDKKKKKSKSSKSSSRVSSADDNRDRTIYVSNLRRDIQESYLERKFGKHGEIEKIDIVRDPFTKESRGFCFITFTKAKDAEVAVNKMNKKEMKKRIITVEISRRGKPRKKTPGRYMGRTSK